MVELPRRTPFPSTKEVSHGGKQRAVSAPQIVRSGRSAGSLAVRALGADDPWVKPDLDEGRRPATA